MKIYTRNGDEGETGLLYGGKVSKSSSLPEAYGTVDEAQAILGLVRTECEKGSDLEEKIIHIERDLYVLMAELATDTGALVRQLDPANSVKAIPFHTFNENEFRWSMNENPMATEKLAEGIRAFTIDQIKLEQLLSK